MGYDGGDLMKKRSIAVAVALASALVGGVWIRRLPVDRTELNALVQRARELDTDALVILKDGRPLLEKWFHGSPRPIETMSVTKSVVWLAIARLVTVGKIKSLDEPVHTWFPEWRHGSKRKVTLRHLLTQTSGIKGDMDTREIYFARDFVRLALEAPLAAAPGEKFVYNNKATNLLAGVVERVSGKRLDDYLRDEIFTPLGITRFEWTHDRSGNPHASSGLRLRPDDLAKLGQLMLDEGDWNGREIIAARWIREAIRPSERNARYGQLWWMATDESQNDKIVGFRAAGWQGQHLIVLPSARLVVVRMRETKEGNTADQDRKYAFPELTKMAAALVSRQQKHKRPLSHSP